MAYSIEMQINKQANSLNEFQMRANEWMNNANLNGHLHVSIAKFM